MIRVAFYISNSHISSVDCREITKGNPGIGGTEYQILSTSYYLCEHYKNVLSIHLLTETDGIFPAELNCTMVSNKKAAIDYSSNNQIDILVLKYEEKDFQNNLYDELINKLKIVLWAHNVIPNHILRKISKIDSITRIVNVGREQLDLYRDNKAFLKSTYIYNGINIKPKSYYESHSIPFAKRKKVVTYLGSLVPAKGFHVLAKVWPDILRACPDAHLNIIGSGSLYGENKKFGRYGIADEEYEQLFMPFLTDKNGNILPSITFYGKLGEEKNKILGRTKVGVPNPSGFTETFCLSAVEMELYQCRIVTKKYLGFFDTVPTCAGILVDNEKELVNSIIRELNKTEYNFDQSFIFINSSFSINVTSEKWKILFEELLENKKVIINKNILNRNYNYKIFREFNRILKKVLPMGYLLPTVDTYINILNRLFPILNIKILY